MPRLRKLPTKPEDEAALQALVPEDRSDPTEPVTIELPEEDLGNVTVSLDPEVEKIGDDDVVKNALAAQQRAEELQRQAQRERDDARNEARQRQVELEQERGNAEEAQYNSVLTAIAAEENALAKAETDYQAAMASADWQAVTKANREQAVAAARLDRLQDNKRSFDTQRDTQKTRRQETPPQRPEAKAPEGLPTEAKAWLQVHPEMLTDPSKNDKLGATHNYLVKTRGLTQFSPEYFEALDTEFGFKKAPAAAAAPQTQRKTAIMTAPVSRDVPTASGQRQTTGMTLTPEERIIARNSFGAINGKDLTNAEKEYLYAQNKAKLHRMRANGQYHHTTEQTG